MKRCETDKRVVIFIHGYGSDRHSSKYQTLLKLDPNYYVVDILESDYINDSAEQITQRFNDLLKKYVDYDDPIIVGHSLGGFWARKLTARTYMCSLLLNPSLVPTKLGLKDPVYDEPCGMPEIDEYGNKQEHVYIELGDEVVDQQGQIDRGLFAASKLTTVVGGHHRLEFLNNIITEVIELNSCAIGMETFFLSD